MSAPQNARDMRIAGADPAFRHDVLNGLSVRPRGIPARWFYDRAGSELFEAITELPEYYVTRIEQTILSSVVHEIAEMTGPGWGILEFGSGSCAKTRILFPATRPPAYVPVDISREFLLETAARLAEESLNCRSIRWKQILPRRRGSRCRSRGCHGSASFRVRPSATWWWPRPSICSGQWRLYWVAVRCC